MTIATYEERVLKNDIMTNDIFFEVVGAEVQRIRPIEGFEGYFIADTGIVISTRSGRPKALTPDPTNCGHLRVTIGSGRQRRRVYIHQLVLTHFIGPRPSPDHISRHKDGDPANNRLSNLEWATREVNAADRVAHSRKCGRSLSDDQVRAIRELARKPEGAIAEAPERGSVSDLFTFRLLAELYGVLHRYVSGIVRGRKRRNAEPMRYDRPIVIPLPPLRSKS